MKVETVKFRFWFLFSIILLLTVPAFAHDCGPCQYWDTGEESCEPDYGANESYCPINGCDGHCWNGGCVCDDECCSDAGCPEENCEHCVSCSCQSICGSGETCCGGECCDCCNDAGTGCCNSECCGGECCYPSCCNSWDCEHCVSGNCETCLYKASDYEELQACSRVDDPDASPSPNGCSVPPIICVLPDCDNPTGCDDTSFLGACNQHDNCYQTCHINSKGSCDNQFLDAMWEVCMGSSCAYPCSQFANAYYGAVNNYGDSAWKAGQLGACACCDCN